SECGARAYGGHRAPLGTVCPPKRNSMMASITSFPALLQDFFSKRLIAQRQASPHTVASYRDTFRLFLRYAHDCMKKPASTLTLAELDALVIIVLLDHLIRERLNKS